jgi:hypothetical protein
VKRSSLLRHLRRHGCVLKREGASHLSCNPNTGDVEAVSRHVEIANRLAAKIPAHFGMMPPMLGGDELGDRFDVVLTLSGLDEFDLEYAQALRIDVDGLAVPVLPLARVIASKRAAGRTKDVAVLPALEAALAAREWET